MRINNVFDRYDVTDSTKSMERSRRVTNAMGLEVKIRNPSKPLPRQLDKYTFVIQRIRLLSLHLYVTI